MIVLDASAILKGILLEEAGSEKVLGYFHLHQAGAEEIVVPSLLYYEAANIIGRTKRKGISPPELLEVLISLRFKEEILSPRDFLDCLTLMNRFAITAYDAAYIALSQRLKVPFITADAKLYQKTQTLPNIELLA